MLLNRYAKGKVILNDVQNFFSIILNIVQCQTLLHSDERHARAAPVGVFIGQAGDLLINSDSPTPEYTNQPSELPGGRRAGISTVSS
jgi:hypothetical protein